MEINHEILRFYPESGSLEVKYTTDFLPEGLIYNIDVPIVDNKYPTPDELEKLIIGYRPIWQLERINALKSAQIPKHLMTYIVDKIITEDKLEEYQYSIDWVSSKISIWDHVLCPLGPRKNILEIGSYEGKSAVWFIQNLLDTEGCITCIDNWGWNNTEPTFNNNVNLALAETPTKKLVSLTGDSNIELAKLIVSGTKYDLIYVDGNCSTSARASDAIIAWQLLEIGGLMIIDDYLDMEGDLNIKLAVDSFCNVFINKFVLLYLGQQVIIKKVKE